MKWIKCLDQLPEEDKIVLIFAPKYENMPIALSWINSTNKKWFKETSSDCCSVEPSYYENNEVIYWRELPPFPKGLTKPSVDHPFRADYKKCAYLVEGKWTKYPKRKDST